MPPKNLFLQHMGSVTFTSSSPHPTLFSFFISAGLVLLISFILAFLFFITSFLILLSLVIFDILRSWIQDGTPAHDIEAVGESILSRHNDHNLASGNAVYESMTLLKIFWVQVWQKFNEETIAGEQQIHQFFEMLPPPVKYERHVGPYARSDECVICLDDFLDGDSCRVFPVCKHIFHLNCIDDWLNDHVTCPVCRKSML